MAHSRSLSAALLISGLLGLACGGDPSAPEGHEALAPRPQPGARIEAVEATASQRVEAPASSLRPHGRVAVREASPAELAPPAPSALKPQVVELETAPAPAAQ